PTGAVQRLPMIVLHHDLVAQIGAMPSPAAGDYRGNVEETESGNGLPGVKNPAGRTRNRIHVRPSGICDAASPLQQVEERALSPEDPAQVAVQHPHDRSRGNHAAIGHPPFNTALTGARDGVGIYRAREDPSAAILDDSFGCETGGDGYCSGDVGRAVFRKRDGGDALGVAAHRPNATMRSMAPRARAAMSGGTVT